MRCSFSPLAVAGCVAVASASLNTTAACTGIAHLYPDQVAWPPGDLAHLLSPANLNFTYTQTHYWNGGNGQLVPSCIFYPKGAKDVSDAVKIINQYPDVPWAVKSGGHNANKGYASVSQGVLISFRPFMTGTTLSADHSYAHVQPGARWNEAVGNLSSAGKALVGGRLGDVGVGGYTLGGGLSFLSSEYGFACDLVQAYEVVLADGTIANVTKDENTDLFYALKGGGNQFAIVTKLQMLTVPIGQVWGGIKIYSGDKAAALVNATHDFAADYPDEKAAVIVTYESLLDSLANIFFVFFFYNGATVPQGVFDKFDAIEPLIDQTKVQSYADLLDANDEGNIYGFNYLIRAQTIPLMAGDDGRSLMQYQYESFMSYAQQQEPQNLDLMIYSFAFQPLPRMIQEASNRQGDALGMRNAMGLDPAGGDRIWMEYDISWVNPLDEQRAYSYADHFTNDIVGYVDTHYPDATSTGQTDPAAPQTSPLFYNDGMSDQATSLFYHQSDYAKLKAIQQKRDPNGFFSQRTGGFKFT